MKGLNPFKCLLSAAVLVAVCAPAGAPLYGADRLLTVGVVLDEATRGEREPLRDYLTKAMGRPVNLAAPDSYRETVAHLADGSYDFACLGALMYMRAHADYGVIPLVRRTIDLHYRTVFITGADSSIHSLSDLMGKQFAFGDIDSTSSPGCKSGCLSKRV
jgi:phosphonate transport system substrate-binding protein